MAQDIRDLIKNDKTQPASTMPEGHEARFLKRLDNEFSSKKENLLRDRSPKIEG